MLGLTELLLASPGPDPRDSPAVLHRRRVVCTATVVVGSALLAGTLGAPRGSARFFVLGALVALTWLVGSVAAGPLHLGHRGGLDHGPRSVVAPVALAVVSFAVFLAADLVARHVPVLGPALHRILATADAGPRVLVVLTAVVNGAAEEIFFRGALYSAFGSRKPAVYATVVYVAVTVATLNVVLVLAAVVMGGLWALERRGTRGLLAPLLTHSVWSVLMLIALPR